MSNAPRFFERRLVAFVDILGWTNASQTETPEILTALKHLHDAAENYSNSIKSRVQNFSTHPPTSYMAINIGAFSDCIAISMPANHGYMIFSLVASVCNKLLQLGFLTRGGITIGDLYHVENVIVGPAIVEAVEMEKEAIFPRLICSRQLMDHLDKFTPEEEDSIILDRLGRNIANLFLFGRSPEPEESTRDFANGVWHIPKIESIIEDNMAKFSAEKNDKLFEKWRYMQDMLPVMLRRFGTQI